MNRSLNETPPQLNHERLELTSLKHAQFHPYITELCSLILIATRFAFAGLIDGLPRQSVTVTPGFLNSIFDPSEYDDDLLRVWNEELTAEYGIQPIKVTEYVHHLSDGCCVITCDISLKLSDNINRAFLKHNASAPNFVINLDCDEAEQPTRSLKKSQLHDLQWVELKNSCIWEQLTLSQWREVLEDLRKEFLFVLIRYDTNYFRHY